MKLSIKEQKRYLFENLELESLRNQENNQVDVKSFKQPNKGNAISDYLINKAWDDDRERNTKVFLVRDKATREIAFYFAINCGILFSDLNIWNLSPGEKEPFGKYVEAIQKLKQKNLTKKEEEAANEQLSKSMGDLWEAVGNPDRVSELFSLADEKVQILEEKREVFEGSDESEHIQQVQETFPAIDIKFLGRNANYEPAIQLDFKLGVYIFWEMIVPLLTEISEKVGCKYIYLFAADNTENPCPVKEAPMWTSDYDPNQEDEQEEKIHTLVNYYMNELKFRYVTKYKILKPHFERTCFTLVQEVSRLQENRELVWRSHISEQYGIEDK